MLKEAPDRQLEQLRRILEQSDNIVFFGGAGVSTESGIPDFRSKDGLYNQHYAYPPEEIVSRSFFDARPREFYAFYRDRVLHPEARPNPAHLALARLEHGGKLKAVITQKIDGLHQAAGSREVIELHGSTLRNHCMRCGATYSLEQVIAALDDGGSDGIPHCTQPGCDGIVRPDVVLYEEPLDEKVVNRALHFIGEADVLLIGGTSLVVYPAAGFIRYFTGSKLVVLNKGETPGDAGADLVIRGPIGEILGAAVE
jgi:NAD-dependent deacetylase